MDNLSTAAKPATLVGIALTAIGSGAAMGAATNAINVAVSPTYFRNVLRWHDVENIGRAAVAQGIFEGLIFGSIFAIVFTLVVGRISGGRATFAFALRHLAMAMGIGLGAWCLGGVVAIALATLSPEFYRSTFRDVPTALAAMLRYAWVGGSIWGVLFGAALAVVIASLTAAADWRRQHATSP